MSSLEKREFEPRFGGSYTRGEPRGFLHAIMGEGNDTWQRTPDQSHVSTPITAEQFQPSMLLRRLRLKEDVTIVESGGRSNPDKVTTKQRTRPSQIIAEVYHRVLPPSERDFGLAQQKVAEQEEAAYFAEGCANDEEYQLLLMEIASQHRDSTIMQGIAAFREASVDFYGSDIYGQLFHEARMLTAHMIHTKAH